MLDTLELLYELRETFDARQAESLARVMGKIYRELANTVTKVEFEELRKTVSQLADNVKELAEAQKKTEERVNELAVAQKRTEERLNELAEAQKKTEERLNELVEAQKKTEEAIKRLVGEIEEVKEQVGGLSHTVGYTLENEAYKALPSLLKRDYNLEVTGRLKRGYIKDSKGQAIEVNIIGEAKRNGKRVFIVGESKVKLSKNDVRRFIERRVKRLEPVLGELFPLIVTHMISEPNVEEYAKEKGVVVYYSYDF